MLLKLRKELLTGIKNEKQNKKLVGILIKEVNMLIYIYIFELHDCV